ncbi:MAG: tyrosine-type recombinase/integrase [Firmicutes bacterium]|uniref:Tyrosine-type recombinase/integrase n=1 Tax=Candidatus Scybalomonas excrementavium TaxID=2840943 RepID=A0A9D9I1K8_9FIRM|nr:tyrosine-type recombinase/integrase [Candidatus Scybalomonas excrementavium]
MEQNYHKQIAIENQVRLRELLLELPKFCSQFFRGIEQTTSSRTRISYAYDLKVFFEYLMISNPSLKNKTMQEFPISILDEITPMDIEEYMEYLKYYVKDGKEYINNERGISRKLSSLRSFYRYFYKKQLLQNNPPSLVDAPKIHEKAIIRLEQDEIVKLLDAVESGDKLTKSQKKYHEKTKIRDLALLTLLLGTGIRVSECVGLNLSDVDTENYGIRILRKGGEESIIYFGDEVYIALLPYLEQRERIIAQSGHEEALFLSMQNRRINVRSVENLVKKYASIVTSLKKITPHKLRSTYGTRLYEETSDIYLVADVLGHKDVNTTKKHYAAQNDLNRRRAGNAVPLRKVED